MEELWHTFTYLVFVIAMSLTCVCGIHIEFNSQSKQANTLIANDRNAMLTCVVPDLSADVYWDISEKQKSFCLYKIADSCYPDTTDSGLYKYSSAIDLKEFYLTIPTVPFNPAQYTPTEFRCNHIVEWDVVELQIAKVEDKGPTITYDTRANTVTAVTDCVYPTSGIKITWFYIKKDSNETEYPVDFEYSTDESECSGKGDKKVKAMFKYDPIEGGQEVELKVVVSNAAGRKHTVDTYYRLSRVAFYIAKTVSSQIQNSPSIILNNLLVLVLLLKSC